MLGVGEWFHTKKLVIKWVATPLVIVHQHLRNYFVDTVSGGILYITDGIILSEKVYLYHTTYKFCLSRMNIRHRLSDCTLSTGRPQSLST